MGLVGKMIMHGYTSNGKRHPLYYTWLGMRQRCSNPKHISYKNYGARGITVCERWDNFGLFLQDVGERPTANHTLDRIDSNGSYEPGNVKWATWSEQGRHRGNSNEVTGVRFNKRRGSWVAQLAVNGVRVLEKSFKNEAEAIAARKEAEVLYML